MPRRARACVGTRGRRGSRSPAWIRAIGRGGTQRTRCSCCKVWHKQNEFKESTQCPTPDSHILTFARSDTARLDATPVLPVLDNAVHSARCLRACPPSDVHLPHARVGRVRWGSWAAALVSRPFSLVLGGSSPLQLEGSQQRARSLWLRERQAMSRLSTPGGSSDWG